MDEKIDDFCSACGINLTEYQKQFLLKSIENRYYYIIFPKGTDLLMVMMISLLQTDKEADKNGKKV